MDHAHHQNHDGTNLRKVAFSATVHCLTGCAVGEVLGMVIGNYFNIHNIASIVLSIVLAFIFGYLFSIIPLLKHGLSLTKALALAFAADTVSITIMEIMDNLIILLIPGAMDAGLNTVLFWGSLAVSLFVAFWSSYPVNMYLISKGKGHAVVHGYH
ncbi:MAG: DUF4396 domain-containing protein [Candidatus Levybacteria bacterium]|nr:DUF4396 domain-containing protein [Candidatus Levybacteria bacterium]MBP9815161.1 DUF4396 domain-containing protein [Candidatus Levybacteria bacterium]